MKINRFARAAIVALMTLALASCTTITPAEFAKNPKAVSQASLCRTFLQAMDPVFQQQIAVELNRRGIQTYDCPAMVQQQDQAAAAIVAVALIGTAVAVCSNNNCGAPSYPSYQGNCRYSWQRDARGRRCGDRAADRRAGGW
ncbi:hypothetical protein [Rhizobium sp. Leaf384]|uniref:hypothetical protein n=1 Tax=Rhizobium sp. Leaf384 TaxID=1736358 RepID=UPI00138F9407|nr:hypothetical protein [Rhizobium sp. Leaf384]